MHCATRLPRAFVIPLRYTLKQCTNSDREICTCQGRGPDSLSAAICPVCYNVLKRPVVLPCGHTFCDGLCSASEFCALCRAERGVGQLPRNFTAEQLIAQTARLELCVAWNEIEPGRLLADSAGVWVRLATYNGQSVAMKVLRSDGEGGARLASEVTLKRKCSRCEGWWVPASNSRSCLPVWYPRRRGAVASSGAVPERVN